MSKFEIAQKMLVPKRGEFIHRKELRLQKLP